MHKKIIKIAFIIVVLSIIFISNIVLASSDNFDFNKFDNQSNGNVDKITKNFVGTALKTIRIVGTGISIIMLTYIGIKYMMAAPAERAEFKKTLTIYILGAILVFSATNILAIIADFTNSNITNS